MKRSIAIALLLTLLALSGIPALAGDTLYSIRADGLACPYCARGIQKAFMNIKDVESVNVDLKKGLVLVRARDSVHFTDAQLNRLFKDAGFTYRGFEQMAVVNANEPSK